MDGVETLAETYGASVEATARRWVDLAPDPWLLLVFRTMTKPREAAGEPRLRLAYGHGTPGAWPFLRRWKSVAEDSTIMRALKGDVVEARTRLGDLVSEDPGTVHVSAREYGPGRVIALVRRAA